MEQCQWKRGLWPIGCYSQSKRVPLRISIGSTRNPNGCHPRRIGGHAYQSLSKCVPPTVAMCATPDHEYKWVELPIEIDITQKQSAVSHEWGADIKLFRWLANMVNHYIGAFIIQRCYSGDSSVSGQWLVSKRRWRTSLGQW